jgi:hypothetical protein
MYPVREKFKHYDPGYENALKSWLREQNISFLTVDEHKRRTFGTANVKSFDLVICPDAEAPVIAEIKGRKFRGTTLMGKKGLDSWVTAADIEGLSRWTCLFGDNLLALIIFAYRLENYDVDPDGHVIYPYENNRYVFFAVTLSDYRENMKIRSPKWQTHCLSACNFRKIARPLEQIFKV